MKRYFEEERIKECLAFTGTGSMRKAIRIMLNETPDIAILPAENADEEMWIVTKRKETENE